MTREEKIAWLKKKEKQLNTLTKNINKELDIKYTKDINKIIKKAINDFYSTYRPKYYKRKWSLKYMYDFKSTKGDILLDFDAKYTRAHHRVDNDYIFNLVFMQGYHGGAPSIAADKVDRWGEHPDTGVPYWRFPPKPWEDENGEMQPPYTEWGRKAKQDKSPMDRINEALDKYEEDMPGIQRDIIKKELKSWLRV